VFARIAILVAVLIGGNISGSLRALRAFSLAYLLQLIVVACVQFAPTTLVYGRNAETHGFVGGQLVLLTVILALITPAIIWCASKPQFFLRVGDLRACVCGQSIRWSVVAPAFAAINAICAGVFVEATGISAAASWRIAVWAVVFASVNAFEEEVLYRNVLLGAVRNQYGSQQAMLVSALIFGIGHWNGLPAGVVGVLMTVALGLITARAMLDTRGLFWPWFMHFVPDCVLFYSWGIGAVGHGTIDGG
jgi:membrane protease YdiL (CAAX protease family)